MLRGLVIRLAKRTGGGHTSKGRVGGGAIIAAVLALSIAMTVAWGWAAGMAFGFVVAIAFARMAG